MISIASGVVDFKMQISLVYGQDSFCTCRTTSQKVDKVWSSKISLTEANIVLYRSIILRYSTVNGSHDRETAV